MTDARALADRIALNYSRKAKPDEYYLPPVTLDELNLIGEALRAVPSPLVNVGREEAERRESLAQWLRDQYQEGDNPLLAECADAILPLPAIPSDYDPAFVKSIVDADAEPPEATIRDISELTAIPSDGVLREKVYAELLATCKAIEVHCTGARFYSPSNPVASHEIEGKQLRARMKDSIAACDALPTPVSGETTPANGMREETTEQIVARVQEACAQVADRHKGSAKKRRGLKSFHLGSEDYAEIVAEERGEDIAAEIIGRAIRALIPAVTADDGAKP